MKEKNKINYDKECPGCGIMLDYVFDFEKNRIHYWCHLSSCGFTATYKLIPDNGSGNKFFIKTKTGRRANGYESDRGSLNHAVPENSYRAICGAEPGRRADWSSYSGDRVTCPKCLKKLAGIQDPEIIK